MVSNDNIATYTDCGPYSAAQLSRIAAATELYDAGLHVFPVIFGSKYPHGRHGFLNAARLWRPSLPSLFADNNISIRTGRLSQNLFVLDCDSPSRFDEVGKWLADRNIVAWIRSSVRGGQYWLRCEEGEIKNKKDGDLDVLGNGLYSLVPPSFHPSGSQYRWVTKVGSLPQAVSVSQMQFLSLELKNAQSKSKEKKGALPLVADTVLIGRDASAYHSDSEAEYAACLSMIGAGYSDDVIMTYFRMNEPPHYSKVGLQNFVIYILNEAHAYHDAQPTFKSSISNQSKQSGRFVECAQKTTWPGRGGNTDKCVYLALCERMRMDQGDPFRASIRELAELANIDRTTTERSLKRLIANKLVVRDVVGKTDNSNCSGAGCYRLTSPSTDEVRTVFPTEDVGKPTVRTSVSLSHDIWTSKGLGKSCWLIWDTLMRIGSSTQNEIASATGKSLRSIKPTFAKLVEYDLVIPTESGWMAKEVSRSELDIIALSEGALGTGGARVAQHLAERQRLVTNLLEIEIRKWKQSHGGSRQLNQVRKR